MELSLEDFAILGSVVDAPGVRGHWMAFSLLACRQWDVVFAVLFRQTKLQQSMTFPYLCQWFTMSRLCLHVFASKMGTFLYYWCWNQLQAKSFKKTESTKLLQKTHLPAFVGARRTCWALACSKFPRCSTSSANVGLSVGRSNQQSNMVWYLPRGKV